MLAGPTPPRYDPAVDHSPHERWIEVETIDHRDHTIADKTGPRHRLVSLPNAIEISQRLTQWGRGGQQNHPARRRRNRLHPRRRLPCQIDHPNNAQTTITYAVHQSTKRQDTSHRYLPINRQYLSNQTPASTNQAPASTNQTPASINQLSGKALAAGTHQSTAGTHQSSASILNHFNRYRRH